MGENKTPELGSLEQPATKEYRVVGLGARYRAPQEAIGADGKPTIVYVSHLAGRGETVSLVEHEAKRLLDLGVVREADAPREYDELGDDELAKLAQERSVPVASSSADPARPRREDYINALRTFDQGGAVGAATAPGGVIAQSGQGVPPITLDGRTPAPSTADGPPSEGDLARGNEVPRPPEQVREEADGDQPRRGRRQRASGSDEN